MSLPEFTRPSKPPDLEAEIAALPTVEGGRFYPMYSGYRPNHDLGLPGELNDAMHEYPDTGQIQPGESGKALLWLLVPERQQDRLFIGMTFTVQEGSRLVGRGRINRVINEKLLRPVER